MTIVAADLAAAATALVGTPFRLHGRDPATGLDCVGVLEAALTAAGAPVRLPGGYGLRVTSPDRWLPDPATLGMERAEPPFCPGDVVLFAPGPAQAHVAICAGGGDWVHAHLGLRRVVRAALPDPGPIIHHWRLAPDNGKR